ncbi:MAG TPA: type II CAAX endopeptidase family protein [Terriglobales bacterium]|nr:type II CAAX endopeptidase family protein [Terriglobales bacterium]
MSSPPNPYENLPPVEPEFLPPVFAAPEPRSGENPPWNGWDVILIVAVTIGASLVLGTGVVIAAHVLFRSLSWGKLAQVPELVLTAQFLTYVVVFAVMYATVASKARAFWKPIRWNWPRQWVAFLFAGTLLYFALAGLGQLLPIPKQLPIDRFFNNAREATLMSVFAVSMAPLMEELFFRGFLYPVLARRIGVSFGILLTSAAFAILHGAQLKYSWAVLIIFFVGLALTIVRAVTKSVACTFLMHVGYNGTLSLLMYVVTGGFRHLEKLNQ